MEKDITLLSRVTVNHIFLGQFEAFRANLLSLRKRKPELALAILQKIVSEGGRIDGILWSRTLSTPSDLTWLSALELSNFNRTTSTWNFDANLVRLKAEFILLIQIVASAVSGIAQPLSPDLEYGFKGDISDRDKEILYSLNKMMQYGLERLKSDADYGSPSSKEVTQIGESDLQSLWNKFIEFADIFNSLCWNIQRQLHWFETCELDLAISMSTENNECLVPCSPEVDALPLIQKQVQMAHLTALRERIIEDDIFGAFSHIRFLHLNYGVLETEYKSNLQDIIKNIWLQNVNYGEKWKKSQDKMALLYAEALSSKCIPLVRLIQLIQDEIFLDEIEKYRASNTNSMLLPIKKYLETLKLLSSNGTKADQNIAIRSCRTDLYHYSRLSSVHIFECVMNAVLSAVKSEQLQVASDVLSLFPLLQPLVAVLGWDLLSGRTASRRKLMQLLWTSKSHVLRTEEYPLYGKKNDEISCVEYQCDLLCFNLDLARFVSCINSGQPWSSKASLLYLKKEQVLDTQECGNLDSFVENFVLERLSVETPLRVLFDVVPGIKFQDAIELLNLQPIASPADELKRMQDIELIRMRYALESVVLALGAMEESLDKGMESHFHLAIWYLKDMEIHLEAINNITRKIYVICIISSLLQMDETSVKPTLVTSSSSSCFSNSHELFYLTNLFEGGCKTISFTGLLLDMLQHSIPEMDVRVEPWLNSDILAAGRQALEWRVCSVQKFIEDWKWRLSILQRLEPLSKYKWSWKEVFTILRAAPSKLLNLCLQREKYDLGEEAVHRFSLPAEDKAVLDLNEWVAGSFKRVSVEDVVTHAAEGTSSAFQSLQFSSLRSQLGPLAAILLCIDVAVASSKSVDVCKVLLGQSRDMLSEIYPGNSPKIGSLYWKQIQEVAIISVIRRVLQRLHGLVEQDNAFTLQELFVGDLVICSSTEAGRQGQRQRALLILHQMIGDAHKGRRQFLSGKLHNLARAVVDEDSDGNFLKAEGLYSDKKHLNFEKSTVLGLGLKVLKSEDSITPTESDSELTSYAIQDNEKRFYGSLTLKASTYLSSFIIYIATIGDIVDGIDTTHDFNFFSLIYERPKDLLIRLVFERGSTDAAGKVADIMGVDFVHEVIAACVPPVLPPRSRHGWACVPVLPSFSSMNLEKRVPSVNSSLHGSSVHAQCNLLYPLQLNVVKHLANLSPVRAVLACVFGSNILSTGTESCISGSLNDAFVHTADAERLFYEFALDQSERFPTLNRWIQMQSNLHRVSESTISTRSDSEVFAAMPEIKLSVKRPRDPESDAESDIDNMTGPLSTLNLNIHDPITSEVRQDSSTTDYVEGNSDVFISFDWENETPYEKAVERLITEGKLMDALALSDRCLHNGASDQLLQLLIDQYEKNPMTGQLHGYGSHNASNTWQYCIRLKDKQLAASLALKYLNNWELNAAIDVLTMCCCHLSPNDPILNEVFQKRQALQRYNHILFADDRYNNWQEVEADCKEDPEGLALRLAGKGAVSAALEVAESASLSVSLRRELQGRQLVKLLTADPLSGGGPAEASRFISSLKDSDDALPAAVGAMQLLPDLRSKKLLVHFFLKRQVANMPEADVSRLNSWALGLGVLTLLPLPSQQRCSSLHEHPQLILEVLLMMKQLESALLILKEFPSLRDDNLILTYASKAISINVNPTSREPHLSVSTLRPKPKPKPKPTIPTRSNFTQSIGNLQKEARRAFSWVPRDEKKSTHLDSFRKRKGPGLLPSEKDSLEAMSVIHEERIYSADGQERLPFVSAAEEWVLSGDSIKDAVVRSSHKYETAPDITLFKALLALCSTDLVSAKGAFELCVSQMKTVLSSKNLPLNASMETIGRVYHATETYVQALSYAKSQLRKLAGKYDYSSSFDKSRDADDTSSDATSSSNISQYADEFSVLLGNVEIWLGRAELLQSLLGSGIVASLDDIDHKDSSSHLRDRLIKDERYSMAVYTCKKCKVDGFPVWIAWGKALIQMEHYTQARIKFKQALQLYKGDPSSVVIEIINMIEGGPPVDVSSVQSMYEHLEKSVPTILDDSLSADSYLNVLYIPSTFPRSERSRSHQFSLISQFSSYSRVEGPHSHLDSVKYGECIYYLQEYARLQMLVFMFRHGHYADACSLFFPVCGVPNPPLPSPHATNTPSTSPQRPDALATDYGTIDDLCDLCIGYGAMSELVDVITARSSSSLSQDGTVNQYIASALARICNYCETHRHFNYLYKFQALRGDNIASGLCCLQLFMNSSSQEEAVRHLEHAKVHFDEGLSARYRTVESTKILPKIARGKSASNKLTEEELIKLSARVGIQVDVVKSLNDNEGPQWKYSLFGNPSDPETFRRRCVVAETLAEKHFDLAFQVIYQFNLPAVDIYASVAASLAERKRGGQLTEFLKNIKGTIDEDDWDQVLGAAINVYAHKHKERPDRLIDMLISSHRKVLACVICGRLKSAFQIASRSGSVADVQYVAHQASYSNALPVLDMCKQWLGQYM